MYIYIQMQLYGRASTYGAMGRRIDSSRWTHWAISHSSQCSTNVIIKADICAILSGMVRIKDPLLQVERDTLVVAIAGFLSR